MRTAASSAWTEGRCASAVRVATKTVRYAEPSAIARTATPGCGSGPTSSGSSATAWPWATAARQVTLSLVRWRMSGSKPRELAAGPVGHLLPAGAGVTGHPGLAGELGQRHRVAVAPRGRVVSRAGRGGPGRGAGRAGRRPPAASAAGAATRRPARGRRPRARARAATARARPRRARSAGRAPGARAPASPGGRAGSRPTGRRRSAPARRRCPRPPPARPPRRSARSSSASAWRTRTSAASVRRTPRPARSSSATPASRSSTASCWETADGVNCSASATAAIVPRACSSCSRRRRRRSSIHKQRYCVDRKKSRSLLHGGSATMRRMPSPGTLLCLASAAAFGAMGIFGKLAYDEGASVGTLLAARFVLAAALFWLVVACSGARPRPARAAPPRRRHRARARRRRLQRPGRRLLRGARPPRRLAALAARLHLPRDRHGEPRSRSGASGRAGARRSPWSLASTGLVLVLAGAAAGALDPLGTALGLAAAVVYSAYILTSEGIAARIGPLALSTLVCTGAATTLTLGGLVGGDLDPGGVSAAGFGWLAGIAVVSTVGAVGLFFAGLQRVGPTAASILSTLEPVVTVGAGVPSCSASRSVPTQLAGGALVLLAVLAVRTPVRVAVIPARGLRAARRMPAVAGPLTGKVALVTGATRGAGRGTAVSLGEAGATVYCTGRTHPGAALGVRPAGDDRGDRRARRRRRRRGDRRRGRPPRPGAGRGARPAHRRRAGPPRRAGQRHLGRREAGRVEHAGVGARPRRRACGCCAWRSTRT